MQRLGCKDLVYQIRIQCMIRSFFKEIKHCNAHCYFVKTMQSSQAGDQAALSTMHCLSFSIGDPIIERGGAADLRTHTRSSEPDRAFHEGADTIGTLYLRAGAPWAMVRKPTYTWIDPRTAQWAHYGHRCAQASIHTYTRIQTRLEEFTIWISLHTIGV